MCGSTKGASSTIYAIVPGGDWLRVEQVRSGGGTVVSVERRRPVALLAEVPEDAVRAIDDRRMAISTSRAVAAAPITPDEIVEAVHVVDAGVVRSWIVASGQQFDLDGALVSALIRADVPQSVLEAMMPYERGMSAPALESQRIASYYGNAPGYAAPAAYANATVNPPQMETMYACPSMGCNAVPNPYSILNGYGVNPYPYGAYPFSPFSTFPGGFGFVTRVNGRQVVHRPVGHQDGHHDGGHQQGGKQTGGRQPVAGPTGRRR
jgi:hypothetical protein